MSGFEVVGVVLGAIPLLISALEHYERGMKTIKIMRHRAKVMHSLATALSTEQTILRNTCETLLGGIVDSRDMKPLLEEPFGPLWQDPDIKALIERRLDHTLDNFEILVLSMKEVVEEMRSKLGLGPGFEVKINDDGPIGIRDMLKIAVQFSTHEYSLKRLADINQKLHTMMTGNLRNEPHRKVPSQEKLFRLLQSVSRSIYNAVRSSLSCTCAQSHGVGFGLPTPRATARAQNEEALVKRLDFHLILANKPQDVKGKSHSSWAWNELLLRLAEIPIKTQAAVMLPSVTNMDVTKSKFARVRFMNDDNPTHLANTPSPQSSGKSATGRALNGTHRSVTDSVGRIPLLSQEARQLVQVKDICRELRSKRLDTRCQDPYGYLLDETAQKRHKFEVYPFRSYDDDECAMLLLEDAFLLAHRPSLAQKYHIAATTASSVLFMHGTLWMPAAFTIKDVFVISRQGKVNFDEIYLAKISLYDFEGPTKEASVSSEATGVSTLRCLGIFLMEVMLWKPLCEFWDDEGVDISSIPLEDIFDYTTAKGFARIRGILERIEGISSPEFKEVVEHCIKCDLRARSQSMDDDAFRQAIYSDIVLPLQDADRLAGGKMMVGKGKHPAPSR